MKLFNTFMLALSIVGSFYAPPFRVAYASDHDDGEIALKGRNLNLTDLYVFREDWQDSYGDKENLVLIMNTNPRSVARQQYFFSNKAKYTFHLSQVLNSDKAKRPLGSDDVKLSFEFGAPDSTGHQAITLKLSSPTISESVKMGQTTTLADLAKGLMVINKGKIKGSELTVFAGLREDSFFFDVERYFRVRALLATGVNTLGNAPTQSEKNPFRADSAAVDFTAGYNVNSIVVKIPLKLLRKNSNQSVFDVWETISVPTLANSSSNSFVDYIISIYLPYFKAIGIGSGQQIERLARPAINEGLVRSNDFLNAYNSIGPKSDLSKEARAVVAEAAESIKAVGDFGRKAGLPAPEVGDVAAGFLPDVMRIDTRNVVAIGKPAYNSDAVIVEGTTKGAMLTGGRKIEDDVMDITLSYLIAGDPSGQTIKDGVSYDGGTTCLQAGNGSNIANPGHRCLYKQSLRNGEAQFPYLASPN